MSDSQYANYEAKRSHGQGSTWYSQMMTMDAVVFIMSFMEIRSKEIKISRTIAQDRKKGHIWSEEERMIAMEKIHTEASAEWKDRIPKLISVVNPANGPRFFPLCKEIYKRLTLVKRKKSDGPMLGLDRARVFSGALLFADLRCTLLEVHYGPDNLKKQYHHPKSNSDASIRLWLQQWSLWCFIEYQGSLLVTELVTYVYREGLFAGFDSPLEEFVDIHKKLFTAYVKDKANTLCGSIWTNDTLRMKGIRAIWRNQTKRVVFCFFIHLEEICGSRFKQFPGAMSCWRMSASVYSMYPCDHPPPAGRVMGTWESLACPWYMDFEDWNKYLTDTKEKAAKALKDGLEPAKQGWHSKFSRPDDIMAKKLEQILTVEPAYDGKKARREKEKEERKDSDVDEKNVLPKPTQSASIISPLVPPSSQAPDPLEAESARLPSSAAQEIPIDPTPSNVEPAQLLSPSVQKNPSTIRDSRNTQPANSIRSSIPATSIPNPHSEWRMEHSTP